MSHNATVNYVRYGPATDSGSIEVNQLQQIKGEWRSHRPLLPPNHCCTQREDVLSTLHYGMDGKAHI